MEIDASNCRYTEAMAPGDGLDEPRSGGLQPQLPERRRLETLPGGGAGPDPAAPVRLVREFKGLTVDELLADERVAELLPGRVRSALQHIERGDLAAAERALPGGFATVLPGPWQHRRRGLLAAAWLPWALLVAAAAVLLCWSW